MLSNPNLLRMENTNFVEFEIHNPNFRADFCNPNFKQGVIPQSQIFPL